MSANTGKGPGKFQATQSLPSFEVFVERLEAEVNRKIREYLGLSLQAAFLVCFWQVFLIFGAGSCAPA